MSLPNFDAHETIPRQVRGISEIMSGFPASWRMCGGWAVDAWLGYQSREHGDMDVSVFEDDQHAVLNYFHAKGWHLIAHDEVEPDSDQPWDGRRLTLPAHIHASLTRDAVQTWVTNPEAPTPEDAMKLEIVIDSRSTDGWVLNPDPRITLPIGVAIGNPPWGVPAATAEVLLFYKATAYLETDNWKRPRDDADFLALLPLLDRAQRDWLAQAIAQVVQNHPWLPDISG